MDCYDMSGIEKTTTQSVRNVKKINYFFFFKSFTNNCYEMHTSIILISYVALCIKSDILTTFIE